MRTRTSSRGYGATLIVTRDRDLLELGAFRDIRILSARDALALIETAADHKHTNPD